MLRENIEVDGYEQVVHFIDVDFSAYIAVHSTTLGPAVGGCRVTKYDKDEDALEDALRLAKGMTLKTAAAGLDYGGGKCVVNAECATPENMRQVGKAVEMLGGKYITAGDVGTGRGDLLHVAEETSHVIIGRNGGLSVWTARGLANCIERIPALMHLPPLHELSVWVQGLGKVGWHLCELLVLTGCKLYVSDIVEDRVERAVSDFRAIPYEDALADQVTIYAPCALGKVITAENVNTIPFRAICGAANNQLATDDLAEVLMQRGILYCPDFIVNAGGVIAATAELETCLEHEIVEHVNDLGLVLDNVVSMAKFAGRTPVEVAIGLAGARL